MPPKSSRYQQSEDTRLYFEGVTSSLPVYYLPLATFTQPECLVWLTISMILVFFPARFFLATMYWARTTPPNRAQTLAPAAAPTFTTAVLSMTVGPLLLHRMTAARRPAFCQKSAFPLVETRSQRSYAERDQSLCRSLFFGGQHNSWLNSRAVRAKILSTNYTFTEKWKNNWQLGKRYSN